MEWHGGVEPPHDGRWIVQLFEDGSGCELWAWYEDEHGQIGWHDAEGRFDGSAQFDQGTIWIEAPEGYTGWIERGL